MRSSWLVMALVGCGGGEGPSGPIEAHASFFDLTPAPDIDIVFHDAAGLVVASTTTDANGVAILDDPSVAMVTALSESPNGPTAFTKVGVEPGDKPHFILDLASPSTPPPQDFTPRDFSITLDSNAPPTADSFFVDFLCEGFGTPSTSATHQLLNDCRRADGKLDVLALAKAGEVDVGFAILRDVELATGTTTLVFPPWQTQLATFEVDWADMPTDGSIGTQFEVAIANGANVYRSSLFEEQDVSEGTDVSRSYTFADIGTSVRPGIEVRYGAFQSRVTASYRTGIAITGSTRIDLRDKLLAPVRTLEVLDDRTTRPTIQWTQDGSHDDASSGLAFIKTATGFWFLQLPPDDATAVRIPQLPPALAKFEPTESTLPFVTYQFRSYLPTYKAELERATLDIPEEFEEITTRKTN